MSRKSLWKRPSFYLVVLCLVFGAAILFVGPDLTKMDWTKIGSRAWWQLPDRVIASLDVKPGDTVADIGAGDGYFTFLLAEAVGPNGRVFAVEVNDELVDTLRRKARDEKYSAVQAVKGEFDDPLLPDGELDLIFLCNSYHHIQNRPEYFSRLRGDLKPGGRVAIIDMKVSALVRLTVPAGHWTTVETMQGEMQKADYRPIVRFDFLPAQNYVLFSPLAAADNKTEH
jgi:ubiquinone/menaquinone biosynthesis C-methylase UbiE